MYMQLIGLFLCRVSHNPDLFFLFKQNPDLYYKMHACNFLFAKYACMHVTDSLK